jgi:hypothetical protein
MQEMADSAAANFKAPLMPSPGMMPRKGAVPVAPQQPHDGPYSWVGLLWAIHLHGKRCEREGERERRFLFRVHCNHSSTLLHSTRR